jgi:uncharacterized membrane protein
LGTQPQSESAAIRNVQEIARLEHEQQRSLRPGERISSAVTSVAGTFGFALLHIVAFLSWMAWNSFGPRPLRFDPYPFGLMTMIVSVEGVILAVFVLITQNRMSQQSDRRDHLDLQVDLLAEQEMTMVLRMLNRISEKLGVSSDDREQNATRQLMEDTNIYQLMEELRRKF